MQIVLSPLKKESRKGKTPSSTPAPPTFEGSTATRKFYEAIKVLKHDAKFAYQQRSIRMQKCTQNLLQNNYYCLLPLLPDSFLVSQNRKSIINIFAITSRCLKIIQKVSHFQHMRQFFKHFKIENGFFCDSTPILAEFSLGPNSVNASSSPLLLPRVFSLFKFAPHLRLCL